MRRLALALLVCSCAPNSETRRIAEAADDRGMRRLEELCYGIGHRLSGSESLDRAIAWAVDSLQRDGHENVRTEKVRVPRWVRGRESLTMIRPKREPLAMLGLGGSVAGVVEAEVVVVRDEKELGDATGKIVLFNNPYTNYGESVRFRVHGARLAAEKGAVACLVRSVASRSLRSPHTGGMRYGDAKRKIPAAAISIEDAETLAHTPGAVVRLEMEAKDEGEVESANVIAELVGREKPGEIVVISGHLDSWDVGQGAHDDGAGCVIAMEALSLLRRLGLRPRRTIRVVLWTNEENGLAGARTYEATHPETHAAAIEADTGGFRALGFTLDMEKPGRGLERLAGILKPLGLRARLGGSGADVGVLKKRGIPLLGLEVDMTHYFDYHHSHADTFDKVDAKELRSGVVAMAALAWAIAELPGRLDE